MGAHTLFTFNSTLNSFFHTQNVVLNSSIFHFFSVLFMFHMTKAPKILMQWVTGLAGKYTDFLGWKNLECIAWISPKWKWNSSNGDVIWYLRKNCGQTLAQFFGNKFFQILFSVESNVWNWLNRPTITNSVFQFVDSIRHFLYFLFNFIWAQLNKQRLFVLC